MALDVTGKEKPVYGEGTPVVFELGPVRGQGRIRGLSSSGLIDFWIVEVAQAKGIDKAVYPWSCLVVPHHGLRVECWHCGVALEMGFNSCAACTDERGP